MSISYYNDLSLMHGATGLRPSAPIALLGRNYYCLQYNHLGTITVRIDDAAPQQIRGPSLLITSPGHKFVFGNNEGWHHGFIAFQGPRVQQYIRGGLLPVDRPLMRIQDGGEFLEQFERCVSSFRAGDRLSASHQFEGLLTKLHQPAEASVLPSHHQAILQFAVAMRQSPQKSYSLCEAASHLHLSEAHLRRLFRKLLGCAPGKFLLQCRLAAASDQLATTRIPIKQIAADYQFESVHHFSRVFSQHYSVPPGRFRRETIGS